MWRSLTLWPEQIKLRALILATCCICFPLLDDEISIADFTKQAKQNVFLFIPTKPRHRRLVMIDPPRQAPALLPEGILDIGERLAFDLAKHGLCGPRSRQAIRIVDDAHNDTRGGSERRYFK
jgi:hypothetical protein